MHEAASYDYVTVRVTPRVDRGEFVNAGVILFCLTRGFLAARIHFDPARTLALWPDAGCETIARHLEAIPRICSGDPSAGPIALLSRRERFHWLAAPRSTVIQMSPVHSGLCNLPAAALDDLFAKLVCLPGAR